MYSIFPWINLVTQQSVLFAAGALQSINCVSVCPSEYLVIRAYTMSISFSPRMPGRTGVYLGHRLQAITADKADRFAGAGDCMTAGTLIAEIVLPGGGGGDVPCAAACGAVAAYDAHAVGVMAG